MRLKFKGSCRSKAVKKLKMLNRDSSIIYRRENIHRIGKNHYLLYSPISLINIFQQLSMFFQENQRDIHMIVILLIIIQTLNIKKIAERATYRLDPLALRRPHRSLISESSKQFFFWTIHKTPRAHLISKHGRGQFHSERKFLLECLCLFIRPFLQLF